MRRTGGKRGKVSSKQGSQGKRGRWLKNHENNSKETTTQSGQQQLTQGRMEKEFLLNQDYRGEEEEGGGG